MGLGTKMICLAATLFMLAGCTAGQEKKETAMDTSVSVCSSMNRTLSVALTDAFAEKYGIIVEFEPLPPAELPQRLEMIASGSYDFWLGGTAEEYFMAAQRDLLAPSHPSGAAHLPPSYTDRDGRWVPLSVENIALLSNRNNIRTLGIEEPKEWDDLLQPVLHEEIVMTHPDSGGASYGMITSLWQYRGRDRALEFAGTLRTQNPEYVAADNKAAYEVYLGNRAVAVLPLSYARSLEKEHEFLYCAPVTEGNKNMITAAAVIARAKHKKAADLFMEFLFSKEARQLMRDHGYRTFDETGEDFSGSGEKLSVPADDLRWMAEGKHDIVKTWLNAR